MVDFISLQADEKCLHIRFEIVYVRIDAIISLKEEY